MLLQAAPGIWDKTKATNKGSVYIYIDWSVEKGSSFKAPNTSTELDPQETQLRKYELN